MNIEKEIKKILIDKDMKNIDLANELGETAQNFGQKLKKAGSMKFDYVQSLLDKLGYEIEIVKKEKT